MEEKDKVGDYLGALSVASKITKYRKISTTHLGKLVVLRVDGRARNHLIDK